MTEEIGKSFSECELDFCILSLTNIVNKLREIELSSISADNRWESLKKLRSYKKSLVDVDQHIDNYIEMLVGSAG